MKSGSIFGFVFILVMGNIFHLAGQDRVFKAASEQYSSNKLSTIFTKADVFALDARQIYSHLAVKRSFYDKITFDLPQGKRWEFYIEPIEIITDETEVYALTSNGKQKILKKPKTKTFKGTFADGSEGQLRLTLNGDFLYGMISVLGEEYYTMVR